MKSVNKVILLGNVGKDPENETTGGGNAIARFTLATTERFKNKSDEWQEKTEWHRVIAWRKLAEIVGSYIKKGSRVYVEGKIQTSSWEDKQSGEKKYRTEIVADDIVLLDGTGQRTESRAKEPAQEQETTF